ncbi:MAG: hypothetical protein KAY22_07405 [Rhizorhabdus sp.]|uniref:hypothetical protein n=1 Tax=Rhizorhabdus sp. TaxID=1968843 RepID=UPI001B6E8A58|nr:hypothetical protein [Rhizorhabdus sp.]MBP8232115.1 hypothetical protein [Rhizorhabdus sp.]
MFESLEGRLPLFFCSSRGLAVRYRMSCSSPPFTALSQVLEVVVNQVPGFEEGFRWYNVRKAVHRHGGRPISGWPFWQRGTDLLAQLHSIWRRADGKLARGLVLLGNMSWATRQWRERR